MSDDGRTENYTFLHSESKKPIYKYTVELTDTREIEVLSNSDTFLIEGSQTFFHINDTDGNTHFFAISKVFRVKMEEVKPLPVHANPEKWHATCKALDLEAAVYETLIKLTKDGNTAR